MRLIFSLLNKRRDVEHLRVVSGGGLAINLTKSYGTTEIKSNLQYPELIRGNLFYYNRPGEME